MFLKWNSLTILSTSLFTWYWWYIWPAFCTRIVRLDGIRRPIIAPSAHSDQQLRIIVAINISRHPDLVNQNIRTSYGSRGLDNCSDLVYASIDWGVGILWTALVARFSSSWHCAMLSITISLARLQVECRDTKWSQPIYTHHSLLSSRSLDQASLIAPDLTGAVGDVFGLLCLLRSICNCDELGHGNDLNYIEILLYSGFI